MFKYWIKDLIIYTIYNIILLTIAYFLGKFYQMLLFLIIFEIIQSCFFYRFHADSIEHNSTKAVRLCKIITICVELIYLLLCNNLNISIYSNIFIVLAITFISCILEYCLRIYLPNVELLKDSNYLYAICAKNKISKNATNRLYMYYIENKSYQEIADLECVDVDSIRKSITRSKNKIFNVD